MATISMGGPSLYGGYLQTKAVISMNLGSDMVNLDLVFTNFIPSYFVKTQEDIMVLQLIIGLLLRL